MVNIHSCQLRLNLEGNRGDHPILKFPKTTLGRSDQENDQVSQTNEIQKTRASAQRKVLFETGVKHNDTFSSWRWPWCSTSRRI